MACGTCKIPAASGLKSSDFCIGEIPGGNIDCSNLTFTTANEFEPGSLQVFINGTCIDPSQISPAVGNMGFDIVLSTDKRFLQSPPGKSERLKVNYIKANSIAAECIVYL